MHFPPIHLPPLEQVLDRSPLTVAPNTSVLEVIALMNQSQGQIDRSSSPSPDSSRSNASNSKPPNSKPPNSKPPPIPLRSSQTDRSSCIAVIEGTQFLGIFTEQDVVRLVAMGINLSTISIAEAIPPTVITLTLSNTQNTLTALALMQQHGVRHLPVVDEQGQFVGLITQDRLYQGIEGLLQEADTGLDSEPNIEPNIEPDTQPDDPERSANLEVANPKLHITIAEQLQAICGELEYRVAERTAELVLSNLRLQQETQQKQQTQQQLAFHAAILAQVSDAVIAVDLEDRIICWNRAAEQLYALSAEDVLGQRFQDICQHQRLQSGGELSSLCALTTQGTWQGEAVHWKKTDEAIYIELSVYVIRNEQDDVIGSLATIRNITDRKQLESEHQKAEVAIRESEERFRNMADHAPVMVWMADPTGYCTYLSQSWYEFSGQTEETGLGFGWLDVVHPDDRDATKAAFLAANQRHEAIQLDYRLRRHDGEYRWAIDTAVPWFGTDGQFKGYIGSVLDISDRKQLELELQASEAKLSRILDNAVAAIGQFRVYPDRSYVEEFMSAGCQMVYGYSQEEMLADPNLWIDRIVPEDIETIVQPAFEQIFSGNTFTIEYRFRDQANHIRWISETLSPHWDEAAACWNVIAVGVNITDRKQTEETLRESEERFRQLAENVAETVFWMSEPRQGQLLYVSPAYEQIWGQSCDSLYANFYGWIEAIHPEDQERIRTVFFECALTGGYDEAYRIVRPDGSIRWIRDRGFPIHNASGEPYRMVGLAEDITDRKHAEAALRQSEEKYRTLFNSIDEGVCVIEMIFDENEKPIDYRFLEINPSFEQQAGLTDALGKRARELVPNLEAHWFEIYGAVALTGEPIRFENHAKEMHRWFDVFAFPFGAPIHRQVAILFKDITERKRREANLAFLADIAEEYSRLSSAEEITQAVGAKIGAYLNVIACNFCEIDEVRDEVAYLGRWNQEDIPRLPDRIRLSEQVSEEFCRRARTGEIIVSDNTQINPITNAQANATIQALSFVTIPFHKNGEWKYLFSIHDNVPRRWREDEIELMRELANRLFPRLERARAEAALRENIQLLRLAMAGAQAGSWDWEIATGQISWSPEMYHMYGLDPADSEPLYEDWYNTILYVDDRPWLHDALMQMVERRQPNTQLEFRIVHPQKGIRWFLGLGHLTVNEQGEPIRLSGINLDITDRKQAEIELLQREEFLNSIYTGVEQAIFVVDVVEGQDFRYLDFNPVSERYSTLTCQQVQGKTPEEAFGHVQGAALRQNYTRCLQSGEKITYEEEIAFPGQTIWTLTTLVPFKNEQGETYRIVGTAINITDRKQLELSLQASEAKLSRILDSAIAAISSFRVYANRDWEYEYWSAGCERLYGYPLENYLDKHFWLLQLHPDDREQVLMPLFDNFFAERDATVEYRFWRKDGSMRWFSSSYTSRKIADDCWIVTAVNHDITSLKQAEAERQQAELTLRSSEEQRRLALDLTNTASWDMDITTGTVVWSDYMFQLFGLTADVAEPSYLLWQQCVHPDDIDRLETQVQLHLQNQTLYSEEYRVIHPDGSIRWMLSKGRGVYDAEGRAVRMVGITMDVTDRKQAEFTLQQQIRQEYLLADIAQDIRRSLNLNEVLSRTVDRVREFLNTDRVVIFRFRSKWQGDVIMESVGAEWTSLLSTTISDPCFNEHSIELYRQGQIITITDVDTDDLEPCYAELLKQFQVKANLIVPIFQAETLWGLLIAHHCAAPRQWQPVEIALLRRLATQVEIAIQQSELYQQTRRELLERRRIQDALQESEERFRSLSASAPIGICQMNADGICLYVNMRWQEMSGLRLDDCLGDGWTQAFHPHDREAVLALWNTCMREHREFVREFRLLTPQNEVRWVNGRATAIHSETGDVTGYVVIHEDITDRKQAEQKIHEQAELLDIATDAIFVQDLENRILFWNKGAERLYGWTADAALGQHTHDLFYNVSSSRLDASLLSLGLKNTIEQGSWQGELEQVTNEGNPIVVQSRWTLVHDDSGQPKSILVVNTDITEKKLLEAQFFRAQRLESIGTLASGIAHDLNNVFTPILAIAQLLVLKWQNGDARSLEMLEMLIESAKRGTDLIKQILTFARGAEGKRISVQLGHILQDLVQVIKQTFPKTINVRMDIPVTTLWTVSADPTQLHQVFMNLCINARDAMPNGGVLSVTAETLIIDEIYARMNLDAHAGHYVVVTITDTGTGISPEHLDRIFDPFFTTKEPGKGTGLGLSTVLGIVKNHGGFVQVSSEVGKGTQFKVYLPAIQEQEMAGAGIVDVPMGNGELILIVDDEPSIVHVTKTSLEDHNYRTLTARDGVEAITLYAQNRDEISAILIDIMMPTMDGLITTRTLHKMNPSIKIIATSGLPSNSQTALAAGAKAFLSKPFTVQELLNTLHDLIEAPEPE